MMLPLGVACPSKVGPAFAPRGDDLASLVPTIHWPFAGSGPLLTKIGPPAGHNEGDLNPPPQQNLWVNFGVGRSPRA